MITKKVFGWTINIGAKCSIFQSTTDSGAFQDKTRSLIIIHGPLILYNAPPEALTIVAFSSTFATVTIPAYCAESLSMVIVVFLFWAQNFDNSIILYD